MVYFYQLWHQVKDISPKCHRSSSEGEIIGNLASGLCVQPFPSSKHSQLNDPVSRARDFVPSLCSHLCLFSANNLQISWTNRIDKYCMLLLAPISPCLPLPSSSPPALKPCPLACLRYFYLSWTLFKNTVGRIGGKGKKKKKKRSKKRKNLALRFLREGRLWVITT